MKKLVLMLMMIAMVVAVILTAQTAIAATVTKNTTSDVAWIMTEEGPQSGMSMVVANDAALTARGSAVPEIVGMVADRAEQISLNRDHRARWENPIIKPMTVITSRT